MNVGIESGDGRGFAVSVTPSGQLAAVVENVVDVDLGGPVTVQEAAASVTRTSATVTTSSGTLVSALVGRSALHLQNQGANPVYVRFESAAATANDWLVAPGAELRLERFRYEGEIRAISTGGNSTVLVLELS